MLFRSDDLNQGTLKDIYTNRSDYNKYERTYRTSQQINNRLTGKIEFYLDNFFELQIGMNTNDAITNALGKTIAHEVGHQLGLFHPHTDSFPGMPGGLTDIMRQGVDLTGAWGFQITKPAGKIAIHGNYLTADVDKALAYYSYPGIGDNDTQGGTDPSDTGPGSPFTTPQLGVFTSDGSIVPGYVDFGNTPVDGVGGQNTEAEWKLFNLGPGSIKIDSVKLGDGSGSGFSIVTDPTGQSVTRTSAATLRFRFDPTSGGKANRFVTIKTSNGETVTVDLRAFGQSTTPTVTVTNVDNNLGGVPVTKIGRAHV